MRLESLEPHPASQPATWGVILIVSVGLFAFANLAASFPGDVSRSQYVQAHGVREQAIFAHSLYSGTNTETWADVTLTRPVNGRTTSVVHVADEVSFTPGQHITVVVDPQQASYSEIAGDPAFSYTRFGPIYLVYAVLCILALIAITMLPDALRHVRQLLRRP